MDKEMKFWDRMADRFDETEKRFEQADIAIIENTKKYLKDNAIVLDYGCAKGMKTFAIAREVKKVYGIDFSVKMIEGAKKRAFEQHVENVDFSQGTIFDDRFVNASFDVILAFNIFHLLKDDRAAALRIAELLKPGGLFISATPCLGEKMAFLMTLQFSFFLLLSKIGLVPAYLKRYKITDLEDVIKGAKFDIIDSAKLYLGITGYFIAAKKLS